MKKVALVIMGLVVFGLGVFVGVFHRNIVESVTGTWTDDGTNFYMDPTSARYLFFDNGGTYIHTNEDTCTQATNADGAGGAGVFKLWNKVQGGDVYLRLIGGTETTATRYVLYYDPDLDKAYTWDRTDFLGTLTMGTVKSSGDIEIQLGAVLP